MKGSLRLVFRYMVFHKAKTAIITASLTILLLLPLSVSRLVRHFSEILVTRAEATPFIVGSRGNRYDLTLKTLYWATDYGETVSMADCDSIAAHGFGKAVPLHVRHSAQKFSETEKTIGTGKIAPLIGTRFGYFKFRQFELAEGTFPLFLGEAVAGAGAARSLGIKTGDNILSTPKNVYDQAESFQLKMPVTGILAETGTPDDNAVFIDIKTAWIIDGVNHGHENVEKTMDSSLINRENSTDTNIVATASVLYYQEITEKNRNTFHLHAPRHKLPVTGIILVPADQKARVMAAGWYDAQESRQMLNPARVIDELLGFVFKIRQFINANYIIVTIAMALLMGLVFMLSIRLREGEIQTLHKIGCSRGTVARLIISEIAVLLIMSLALAWAGSVLLVRLSPLIITFLKT